MATLSHIDEQGRVRMVDVTGKDVTQRVAVAQGVVTMRAETLAAIAEGQIPKGDVLTVARIAGIMAAKKTSELIPMCHPLNISGVEVKLTPRQSPPSVEIEATVRITGKTGVEMEALRQPVAWRRYRGLGCGPHHLRHVQGRGPGNDRRRDPPHAQERRQERHLREVASRWPRNSFPAAEA